MYGSCGVEVFCHRRLHLCSGFSFLSFTHVAFDHLMHLCSAPCPCRCVYICLSHIISEDHTQQNQANMGRRELRGGHFFVPLLWKALGSLSSLKRTGCSWCFLGKGKGKNREESSGLSSVAPHYFRGDSPPSPLLFLFSNSGLFGVIEAQTEQEMQIIPGSEDVQWRDCWDGT